tara:strand:- start:17 stop:1081 length:1065 start_codon:yes stop_codon:yes gene_type:complete
MNFKFNNSSISHIFCCIPKAKKNLYNYSKDIGISEKEAEKIIKTTGIKEIRIASNETSLDLCFEAAKNLLAEISDEEIKKIDALIFVSQTRDYIIPQSANILQDKLNLKTDIICLDIPLGCSGFIYGLFQSNLLIQSGCEKVLLLAGDVSTKMISKYDKTVSMVFGDAGSASLINNDNLKSFYDFGNDGSGYKDLIINDGGFRNRYSENSNKIKEFDKGIMRARSDLYMDGLSIMNFAINRVPKSINKILKNNFLKIDDIELIFFHQANKFILDYLCKKMKFDSKKAPFLAEIYGNTGPTSIPLAISHFLIENSFNNKKNVILSGFGVGLSWGSLLIDLSKLIKTKIINYEEEV